MPKTKCVCFNEWDYMIIMKMINRSHKCDINRTRARHGYKYTKYKIGLSMVMVMCNKQHLSNIWNWIHEQNEQYAGWVEKKYCL